MQLKQLISEKNEAIFKRVSAHYTIKLIKSQHKEDSWGATINRNTNVAEVHWVPCNNPEEAFTHELLHFNCQISGYKRMLYGKCSADPSNEWFINFMTALDNELQHHKMYLTYLQLGYAPQYFFNDDDATSTPIHIESILNTPIVNKLTLLPHYMTVTSVGAETIFNNLDSIKMRFREKCSQRVVAIFDTIDEEIEKWTNNTSYDVEPHIKAIFQKIPRANETYIGYSNTLYDGFFTADTFNLT